MDKTTALDRYAKSYGNNYIASIYKKYSYRKEVIADRLLNDMETNDGFDGRFISGNSYTFSFAYQKNEDGRRFLIYHTPNNIYKFEL